ncbi:hypothetical protein [Streptomyces aureocirculatus]|uniref:hypothetical protein n=1 Tax=Streptomyces aureocirculatus TaxID=67275 RepID=UPI0004C8A01B|nr:hypothetical protein [Streptomyces aureocirculatus]
MLAKTGMGRVALLTTGVALAIGGCSQDTADGDGSAGAAASTSKSAEPSRTLVKWAGQMCKATKLLQTMKTDSALMVKDITDPPPGDALTESELTAIGYLQDTSSSLDEAAGRFNSIRSSGIAAADRLQGSMAKEVTRVQPKVTSLTDPSLAEDSIDRAERVGKLIASLKMPKHDLPAVAADEPNLSAAHRAAPECAPPKPLPKAADGTDVGACKDGACEILVTKQVHLVVDGWDLRVSRTQTKATVHNSGSKGGVGQIWLSAGGNGTFSEKGGDELTFKAVVVNKDGAVLKFRSWGPGRR